MERFFLRATLLIFISFFTQVNYAWNAVGHMVVADIAYQNLKPDVRRKVDDLVEYFQKEYSSTSTFVQMSYWPDNLRGQRIEIFNHWHYINIPFSEDGTPLKNLIDTDNCIWALRSISSITKNTSANSYDRARFLAFFIHIVGDLHQPLHTVGRISAQHPNGDYGGNLFYILYDNKLMKLHHVWDEGFGMFQGDKTVQHAKEISQKITAIYSSAYFGKKIKDLNFNNWADEGMANSKQYVYSTKENKALSSQYIARGKQLVEQQVALAGYRAAELLNKLLK